MPVRRALAPILTTCSAASDDSRPLAIASHVTLHLRTQIGRESHRPLSVRPARLESSRLWAASRPPFFFSSLPPSSLFLPFFLYTNMCVPTGRCVVPAALAERRSFLAVPHFLDASCQGSSHSRTRLLLLCGCMGGCVSRRYLCASRQVHTTPIHSTHVLSNCCQVPCSSATIGDLVA